MFEIRELVWRNIVLLICGESSLNGETNTWYLNYKKNCLLNVCHCVNFQRGIFRLRVSYNLGNPNKRFQSRPSS